jgi:glutamyl-tRNA reductase
MCDKNLPGLACIGLNHQKAPLGLLERARLGQDGMKDLAAEITREGLVDEAVGLRTCNRMEIYIHVGKGPDPCDAIMGRLMENAEPGHIDALRQAMFIHRGDAAVDHLFRVAAGIDSLIVGEAQILGQLRGAFQVAQSTGTSGETLEALLQAAINFGRRVRMETSIGRGNVSVASIACRLATGRFGDLSGKHLLLVGAGETARLAGRHFLKEKIGSITVVNRTRDNAEALALELGGTAVDGCDLASVVNTSDIVVCATSSPVPLIDREMLASRDGEAGHLLLIDLSMPRNIAPDAGSLRGVTLHALEDLEEVARENREQRNRRSSVSSTWSARKPASFWSGQPPRGPTSLRRRCAATLPTSRSAWPIATCAT